MGCRLVDGGLPATENPGLKKARFLRVSPRVCIHLDMKLEGLKQGAFRAEPIDPHQFAQKMAESSIDRNIVRVI
jgi:hypothetical protein